MVLVHIVSMIFCSSAGAFAPFIMGVMNFINPLLLPVFIAMHLFWWWRFQALLSEKPVLFGIVKPLKRGNDNKLMYGWSKGQKFRFALGTQLIISIIMSFIGRALFCSVMG